VQGGASPVLDPGHVYREAQKVDEWPGEDYSGTSVRAGAKVLQALGFIASYHWAYDVETVVQAVLERGPVVVGTSWYRDMFLPDASGLVTPSGPLVGGHAYVLNGTNRKTGLFRAKNSWGRSWGKGGAFWLSYETLERLLHESGEACIALEVSNYAK
jgi:C1A family cysteine protease